MLPKIVFYTVLISPFIYATCVSLASKEHDAVDKGTRLLVTLFFGILLIPITTEVIR